MNTENHEQKILKCLEINLFTPFRQLAECKLIFFAPHGTGVNEENQWIYLNDFRHSIEFILIFTK
jgi:hypothetical protein